MKKLILTVAVAFGFTAVMNAQDLTSKKGEAFLPKQGDWAIGIDASPFLPLLGNGGAPSANFLNNADKQIVFKAFLQDQAALRIKLRIGMNSETQKAFVMGDQRSVDNTNINNIKNLAQSFDPNDIVDGTTGNVGAIIGLFKDPTVVVTDELKTSSTNINLAVGYEKRRGSTRLQGFFGGELMLGIGSGESKTFTYGNTYEKIVDSNPVTTFDGTTYAVSTTGTDVNPVTYLLNPTIDGFNNAATKDLDKGYINTVLTATNCQAGSARITESSKGSIFAFGLRGFIGAEYFILPKLSVGVEYGWGLGISSQGSGSLTVEYWGTAYNYTPVPNSSIANDANLKAKTGWAQQTVTIETGGTSGMSLDTDLSYGAIFLNLHF